MEYLFIYLLQVCNGLQGIQILFIVLSIFSFVFLAVVISLSFSEGKIGEPSEEDKKHNTAYYQYYIARAFLKKLTIWCIVISIIFSLVPTKQTMLLMGGTYLAKKTISSDVVNSKLSKIDAIIDIQLDKYLKELKQEK